ncbi:MAG: ATP-binding protein [Thermodesulfobacteriota bacterium]
MLFKRRIKNRPSIPPSPWIIVGAAIILLVIVVVLAVQNIHREKRYMSRILSEKGAALIKAIEAGARTGMMGMMWGERQVQRLLEETASQPDTLYLAITDESGRVLAHSDPNMVGKPLRKNLNLIPPPAVARETWHIVQAEDQTRAFEVYRFFRPLGPPGGRGRGMGRMHGRPGMRNRMNWCGPDASQECDTLIFAGLDVEPFEEARIEDVRNTVIISSVLILLGFTGFLSLFWAHSYRTTRRLLQDTSAFADEVVANLPVGLIATDRQGHIAFFNPSAESITGIASGEALGKGFESVLPSHWCGLEVPFEAGRPLLDQEMECTFSQGRTVPVSVSASSIINPEGELVGRILILKDLEEIRRLQEEIRRKEKLVALGGLAAGVAHEIRNPLSSIKGLAAFFGGKFASGSEDKKMADVMIQEVDRLNRAISELLDFAKPSEVRMKPTPVQPVLAHAIRLVQQDAEKKSIEIRFSPDPNLPPVRLDSDRFSQCLLNLFLNAIEAMSGGGMLSVRSFSGADEQVAIEIEDTGGGIAPEDLPKIFDPYFTTKPSGTGLGLAVVHKIIEAHQGSIRVRSTPGEFTRFSLFLPADERGQNDDSR